MFLKEENSFNIYQNLIFDLKFSNFKIYFAMFTFFFPSTVGENFQAD